MEFHIPQVYYCNAGTIMRRELFEKLTFYSEEIFIFVDDDFPMKDCVQTIENGMYACIYTEDFDEERDCVKKLLAYCREHGYQICGDYICEEIMEMNVFDSRKRCDVSAASGAGKRKNRLDSHLRLDIILNTTES